MRHAPAVGSFWINFEIVAILAGVPHSFAFLAKGWEGACECFGVAMGPSRKEW
jgi:hypothetical protein